MASTHTTNLGIEKIGFGEQDGTWGTVTNTNFDLIDEAINGIVTVSLPAIGTSGTPNDIDITEGTSSDGRNAFIELTDGGDLGGTAFVRITPNDAEKIVFIRNSLTASRAVNVFQGTYNASNDYTVTAGEDVILKFDGAGTGAVVSSVLLNPRLTAVFTDTISENTAATGVTIEGVLLKDSIVAVDTINESTPAAGVTIDGVLLKDNGITMIGALDADTITTAGALTLQSFGATAVTLNSADVTVDLPLKVDQIDDISGLGVFIEGVKLQTDVLYVDTINELTPTLGVTIEGTELNNNYVKINGAAPTGLDNNLDCAGAGFFSLNGSAVDGSAGVRLFSFVGVSYIDMVSRDSTTFKTGIHRANNHRFHTGVSPTTEAMRIDTAGNVGIGVTAPERLLHVRKGAGAGTVTDGSTYLAVLDSDADCVLQLRSPDTDTQFIRFSTPSSFARASISYDGTASLLTLQSDAQTSFNTGGGTEALRIDASRNVLVGLTASNGADNGIFEVTNSSVANANHAGTFSTAATATTTDNKILAFQTSNTVAQGAIAANGAGVAAFSTFSDERLKENITPLQGELANIMALNPVEFDWKDGSGHQYGFIAQEMLGVYPDSIAVPEDPEEMMTIGGWSKEDARLVKAIQEQQAIINALVARLEALEGI